MWSRHDSRGNLCDRTVKKSTGSIGYGSESDESATSTCSSSSDSLLVDPDITSPRKGPQQQRQRLDQHPRKVVKARASGELQADSENVPMDIVAPTRPVAENIPTDRAPTQVQMVLAKLISQVSKHYFLMMSNSRSGSAPEPVTAEALVPFCGPVVPSISLDKYLTRIVHYTNKSIMIKNSTSRRHDDDDDGDNEDAASEGGSSPCTANCRGHV